MTEKQRYEMEMQIADIQLEREYARNVRIEVAKEIFAEIEKMCIDTFGNFNHRIFAELKKKYTEADE